MLEEWKKSLYLFAREGSSFLQCSLALLDDASGFEFEYMTSLFRLKYPIPRMNIVVILDNGSDSVYKENEKYGFNFIEYVGS